MIGYVVSLVEFRDRCVAYENMSFRFVTWSHLQSSPRSHRGSRRNVLQIGYVVSPAEFSSIASMFAKKRLSDWFRGSNSSSCSVGSVAGVFGGSSSINCAAGTNGRIKFLHESGGAHAHQWEDHVLHESGVAHAH